MLLALLVAEASLVTCRSG